MVGGRAYRRLKWVTGRPPRCAGLRVRDLLRHVADRGVRDRWRLPARGGRRGLAAGVHGPVALIEVLRAIGADVPLRADELRARRAHALQARAAGRAEDVIVLDALTAGRTHQALLGLGEERLLRELTLIGLCEGLLRADDEVHEEPEHPRRHHEQSSEIREDAVLGSLLP